MSEQIAEQPTRSRRGRQTEQPEQPTPAPDGEQPTEQTGPDLERLAALDETAANLPDEDRAAFAALDDKQRAALTELREVAAIGGFTLTESGEFRQATAPTRNRKPAQQAMDKVAQSAYSDWVEAGRPVKWDDMPVITYFLNPDDVARYRTLIRKAVGTVIPQPYEKDGKTVEPTGVRARYGNVFTLAEKMAAKIGHPNDAGKTVLAWAAIDKRHTGRNGDDSE